LKKRYGQHFISDRNILQRIIRLAAIGPEETVLEIGPGGGALTRELAAAARRVIAVEVDRDLIPRLRSTAPHNVEIVEGDALLLDFSVLAGSGFHVVGNLPYNIATPLIRKFIAERKRIAAVTVMIQKDVARRIRASPGSADYGPLSILVQYYANPVWGFTVPPGAFVPRPKVDSAVIRLDWKPDVPDFPEFTDFVHRAFSSRRKKLLNNLAAVDPARSRETLMQALHETGIAASRRPESLSVDEFLRVYNRLRVK